MKRTFPVLLVVLVLLSAVIGCSNRAKPFLGKWSYDNGEGGLGMYYIFKEKGVLKAQTVIGEQNGKPELDYGTYKVIDDDTIQMTDTMGEKKEYSYAFTEDGTKLTISDDEYIMSFTKVVQQDDSQ